MDVTDSGWCKALEGIDEQVEIHHRWFRSLFTHAVQRSGNSRSTCVKPAQVEEPARRDASHVPSVAPWIAPLAPIIVVDSDATIGTNAGRTNDSVIRIGGDQVANATQPIDRTSRNAVRDAYNTQLAPALNVPIGLNGKLSACRPGVPSAAAQQATLDAINYFRAMASMNAVRLDNTLSQQAQAAALVMEANNRLSHYPDPSWKCWSQLAFDGASSSNIALGYSGAEAIAAYMEDYGERNTEVGHRQ